MNFSFLRQFTLFAVLNIIYSSSNEFRELFSNNTNFDEIALNILGKGEMADCCLNYIQYNSTIISLASEYPNLIELQEIGKSYNNNSITVIKLKSKYKNNKAILFTGMHHGREPTSMMMNVYILLKMIHFQTLYETEASELLESVNIYFVPIINVDAYILNCQNYLLYRNVNRCMVRKNRNLKPEEIFHNCLIKENFDSITVGVDLNRNYGYKFNYDDEGSSGLPCNEDYRGPYAFSEPETQAIKNFIDNHPEIKIAFNYHAYGNLLIVPFNYANPVESSLNLFMNYTFQKSIYDEFNNEGHFPDMFLYGNGKETIKYSANGEASDWMLGEKHIVSFSPELGDNESSSNYFYPYRDEVFDVLKKNLNSSLYAISRAAFYLQFVNYKTTYIDCEVANLFKHKLIDKDEQEKLEDKLCENNLFQFTSHIQIHNNGFSDFRRNAEFEISIIVEGFKYLSIKLHSGRISSNNNNNNHTIPDVVNLYEKYFYPNETFTAHERIKFPVSYIGSFLNQMIEIKFYINKEDFLKNNKLNETLFEIKRVDNEFLKMTNVLNTKFNRPEIKIKISDFEKFELISNDGSSANNSSGVKTYFKYIILSLLLILIIVFIIVLWKIRSHNNHINTNIDEGHSNKNPPANKRNNYIELNRTG